MTHRLGDFLFDGAALALEDGMPASQPHNQLPDLAPVAMFHGRDDILSSAILLQKSASLGAYTSVIANTQYARWQNEITTPLVAPPPGPKGYALVEESRLAELTRFESTLQCERDYIAAASGGQESTLSIFAHDRLDPRNPSKEIRQAMHSLSRARLKFLQEEWTTLHANWAKHVAHYAFDTPFVYRDYADASEDKIGIELQDPQSSWLLKGAPVHMQEKKIKMAKRAAVAFRLRKDRDTMLFEDDRSFLCQQMFEAKTRALDYERYCSLALIFGPMPEDEWAKAKSRPGLQYFVRATANALAIQRCWNVFWSRYKLLRFRAARRVQTKFRAWYGFKSLHPLVILRLKFGKRTYYIFCMARWREYNAIVRNIKTHMEHVRTRWARRCYASWKGYAFKKSAKKRQILETFRLRFDARTACFARMRQFTAKSQRIKLWLRTTWNLPQWIMWKQFVAGNKRLKALSRVIVPVQAFMRMRLKQQFYLKMRAVRPILMKFLFVLYCKGMTQRAREEAVLKKFVNWGPEETARRAAVKTDNERRRQLRELQVAEDKASTALAALRKHLRSGNGKNQLIIQAAEYRQAHR